jgi:hypothetical protein
VLLAIARGLAPRPTPCFPSAAYPQARRLRRAAAGAAAGAGDGCNDNDDDGGGGGSGGGIFDMPAPGFEVESEANVAAYLAEHNVAALLEELFAAALLSQPAEPLSFLAGECARLVSRRGGAGVARQWTDDELASLHSLADQSGSGAISSTQAQAALRSLGLRDAAAGAGGGAAVSAAAFVRAARAALDAENAQQTAPA